ncbi:hypothetical protein H072_262 [Dactylellina haptotyla CBS 200.50]|uniref:Ecp2 effector protein domain-containing protein n=1 Tax=Dactylellina haptotyla (strain CBS 200.50) TaxID=1284197 RepID=S8ASN8_DACHA|nr:hypothetical protein H072_262 [Dactylellina haptotyla CBS 200.50]
MHIKLQTTVLAILASMASLSSAAPVADATTTASDVAPTADPKSQGVIVSSFSGPTQSKKRDADTVLKRTDTRCFDSDTFNTDDYCWLENSFWPRTDWYYLKNYSGTSWTHGSLTVCVANKYLSDNTHIYVRNIGDAMAVVGGCCVASTCAGGVSSIRGDSGLLVDVWSIPSWKNCLDTW